MLTKFLFGFIFVVFLKNRNAESASAIDLGNCQNGCQRHKDCPLNSYCVVLSSNLDCGTCLCEIGYRMSELQCTVNEKFKNGVKQKSEPPIDSGNPSQKKSEPTQATKKPLRALFGKTTTTTVGTTVGSPGNGNGQSSGTAPSPEPLNCADYSCSDPKLDPSDDSQPMKIRIQKFQDRSCKKKLSIPETTCNMQNGTACYGYCLQADGNFGYCICPFHRAGHHCTMEKNGTCESGTGRLPENSQPRQNTRWMHKDDNSQRAILARHFTTSFDDCVKLCQWSGSTNCRSINYGPMGGQNVCELLTFAPPAQSWLRDSPGWQEADVVL